MKPKISREEAQKLLVSDPYFEKGHLALKIVQTIIAVFGWIGVFIPFLWLLFPFVFPVDAKLNHFLVYKEEILTFKFLIIFLGISFILIAIAFVLLTIWNNYRFKTLLQRDIQYDEEQLNIRRQLLQDEYDVRFGPEEFRKEVAYYSVKEEQNLDTDFVRNLYKKGGVKL